MNNDFKILTPVTLTLDALAICDVIINFLGSHRVIVHIKDNQEKMVAIEIVDGESQGVSYDAGVWSMRVVSTPTGTTDVIAAMLGGALPGLAAYLLSSGLLTAAGGISVIQPTP